MNKYYNYQFTHFIKSIPDIYHLPVDNGIEIAFVGRSNSGKSSAINALSNQKKLTKTSKIPGCTTLINLFEIEYGIRLIDTPGYGYTKNYKKIKYKWEFILTEYFKKRNNLKGIVMLMDIRHPMKCIDQKIIKKVIKFNIPILILLSKSDKLSYSVCKNRLNQVREKISSLYINNIQIEIFSSLKKKGIQKLQKKLNIFYSL